MSNEIIFLLGYIGGTVVTATFLFFIDVYSDKKKKQITDVFAKTLPPDQPSNTLLNIGEIPTYTYNQE